MCKNNLLVKCREGVKRYISTALLQGWRPLGWKPVLVMGAFSFVGIDFRAYPISNHYPFPATVHPCVKQVVLIFLGQKLSSWSVQQQQLRYDLGEKEERANNRSVCACFFFSQYKLLHFSIPFHF